MGLFFFFVDDEKLQYIPSKGLVTQSNNLQRPQHVAGGAVVGTKDLISLIYLAILYAWILVAVATLVYCYRVGGNLFTIAVLLFLFLPI